MKITKTFNTENSEYLEQLNRTQRSSLIESAVSQRIYERKKMQERSENEARYLAETHHESMWYAVRLQLTDMVKTFSDAGSVLIGNEHFSTTFHNGCGDGTTRVGYIKKGNDVLKFMHYESSFNVNGDNCFIYVYDCLSGDDLKEKHRIVGTIPCGKYDVYSYQGIIALVKID